jgi:hypothetical protein
VFWNILRVKVLEQLHADGSVKAAAGERQMSSFHLLEMEPLGFQRSEALDPELRYIYPSTFVSSTGEPHSDFSHATPDFQHLCTARKEGKESAHTQIHPFRRTCTALLCKGGVIRAQPKELVIGPAEGFGSAFLWSGKEAIPQDPLLFEDLSYLVH